MHDRERVQSIPYAKHLSGRLVWLSAERGRRSEEELPEGARLESDVMLSADGRFREQGVIRLGAGSELRFRTVGTGNLVTSPDPALRHGSVIWELDGGTGRFEHASGRISSSFTVSEDGCVDDDQHGLIFLESERKDS
jgi:hypothetical protein